MTPPAVPCPECRGRATPLAHQPEPERYTVMGCEVCGWIWRVEKQTSKKEQK